jgi:hypothetical protein
MDIIPLRIINVNSEPCTLYKGTIVATCNKISEEDIQSYEMVNNVAIAKSQNLLSKDRQLPAHLQNVFETLIILNGIISISVLTIDLATNSPFFSSISHLVQPNQLYF